MKATLNLMPRRRLLLLSSLIFTLWATWQVSRDAPSPKTVAERSSKKALAKPPAPVPAAALLWPARANGQHTTESDLFSPIPSPVATQQAAVESALPKVVLNFRYVGRLDGNDGSHVFLADAQDRVISVMVGQLVDNDWQISGVDASRLVFRHIPTGHENILQIGSF